MTNAQRRAFRKEVENYDKIDTLNRLLLYLKTMHHQRML